MTKATRRDFVTRVIVSIFVFIGTSMMIYPSVAQWQDQVETYNSMQKELQKKYPESDIDTRLAELERYNKSLPGIAEDDDFTGSGVDVTSPTYQRYLTVGQLSQSSPLAYLEIPKIKEKLPIFHGSSDDVLNRGVGHLYGTSLPVGGKGTHSVLTGHSGLITKAIFTHLDDLENGDTFDVVILEKRIRYKVVGKKEVLPNNAKDLFIQPGKDLLTLVTCTPVGVNTHRLLVTGERVSIDSPVTPDVDISEPSFPWWVIAVVAVWLMLVVWILRGKGKNETVS